MSDALELNDVAAIAREMAMAIRPYEEILLGFSIDDAYFKESVEPTEFYKTHYAQFLAEWESPGNSEKRLRAKAAAAIELVLPSVVKRITIPTEGLPGVVSAVQWLSKLAGVGGETGERAASQFKITLDLGAGQSSEGPQELRSAHTVSLSLEEKPGVVQPPKEILEPGAPDLSGFGERQNDPIPVRQEPEGKNKTLALPPNAEKQTSL